MDLNEQKQDMEYFMTTKKYKLSFFGVSPKIDWTIVFIMGVILIIVFSILYYFDNKAVKSSVSAENLNIEQKKYFDVDKAKALIGNFQNPSY